MSDAADDANKWNHFRPDFGDIEGAFFIGIVDGLAVALDGFFFCKTFDQMNISAAVVGEASKYMLENTEAIVAIHENNPLYIELPASVVLTITYTEPGLQGDRSSGGTKPATVETGMEIQVPLFIKQDEKVLVDTRDGSYQGRAN